MRDITIDQNGATPADLVRKTVDLILGSQFKVMQKCGHLPCVENPIAHGEILSGFMTSIDHI